MTSIMYGNVTLMPAIPLRREGLSHCVNTSILRLSGRSLERPIWRQSLQVNKPGNETCSCKQRHRRSTSKAPTLSTEAKNLNRCRATQRAIVKNTERLQVQQRRAAQSEQFWKSSCYQDVADPIRTAAREGRPNVWEEDVFPGPQKLHHVASPILEEPRGRTHLRARSHRAT